MTAAGYFQFDYGLRGRARRAARDQGYRAARLIKQDPASQGVHGGQAIQYFASSAPGNQSWSHWWRARLVGPGISSGRLGPGTFSGRRLPRAPIPWNARYNIIQWVHASRAAGLTAIRGGSAHGRDHQGNVTLGSLRGGRTIYREPLLSPYVRAGTSRRKMIQLAMVLRAPQLLLMKNRTYAGLAHNLRPGVFRRPAESCFG